MASTVEAGSSPENQKTEIQELLRGQESATRLKILIQEVLMGNRDLDPMAGELADGVLGSLARVLSAWDAGEVAEAKKEAVTPRVSDDRRTENSKRKRKTQTAARDRRDDCRRRGNPYLFKRIKSEMVDDGYAWRKYGQKEIFGAKYPRSYFRCTHKYDRGCSATRQVQRCEEEPSMYLISYMGEHTCKDSTRASQFTIASNPTGSCVINFESNNSNFAQEVIVNSSVSLLKLECDEEVLSSPTSGSSSSVCFVSPELPALEGSMPSVEHNVGTVSDLGDASPLQSSCTSLDMGFMDGMFDLGDLFSIDWRCV